MAALEIDSQTYRALAYDLQAAIDAYTEARAAHALTVDVPAPGAPALVERIVKQHDGLFVIIPPEPEPPQLQPLPSDPGFYRSAAEQDEIAAAVAEEEAIARQQQLTEARRAVIAAAEAAAAAEAEASGAPDG